MHVFALGEDNAIWRIGQNAVNGGWGTWTTMGRPTGVTLSKPAVASTQDGRIAVFAHGSDGTVWWNVQMGDMYLPLIAK